MQSLACNAHSTILSWMTACFLLKCTLRAEVNFKDLWLFINIFSYTVAHLFYWLFKREILMPMQRIKKCFASGSMHAWNNNKMYSLCGKCNLIPCQISQLHANWRSLIKTAASPSYKSWKIKVQTLSKLLSKTQRKTSWGRRGRVRVWLDKLRERFRSAWRPLITAMVQNSLSLLLSSSLPVRHQPHALSHGEPFIRLGGPRYISHPHHPRLVQITLSPCN